MKKKVQLKLLSKILLLVLLISNLSFPLNYYAFAMTGLPSFGAEVNYGRGVFSAQTHGGAICYGEDGRPVTWDN